MADKKSYGVESPNGMKFPPSPEGREAVRKLWEAREREETAQTAEGNQDNKDQNGNKQREQQVNSEREQLHGTGNQSTTGTTTW